MPIDRTGDVDAELRMHAELHLPLRLAALDAGHRRGEEVPKPAEVRKVREKSEKAAKSEKSLGQRAITVFTVVG